MQEGQIAFGRRLIDPVRPMRALAVAEHVRHVGVEAQEKTADGHSPV